MPRDRISAKTAKPWVGDPLCVTIVLVRRLFDGSYLFIDAPWLFFFGLLIMAFSFSMATWNHYLAAGIDWRTIAFAFGVGSFVVGALALPTTRFNFDPARKTISWSVRSFLKRNSGRVPFANVQQVIVQSSIGESGRPFYRVALCTTDATLPLGVEYAPNAARVEQLAKSIRDLLGLT
jgi:hypothetical protein